MLKMTLVATIAAMLLPIAPAAAQRHNGYNRGDYDRQGRYVNPRRLNHNDKVWRGRDGSYHCKRSNGTTGLIIGGAAGALLGRSLDGGRDKTLGTILGAGGGALLGQSIDKGNMRCR